MTVQIVEPRVGYDYEQAGVMLSVSAKTVERLVGDGDLEAHYVNGRMPRIHRDELDRFLLACPTERRAS